MMISMAFIGVAASFSPQTIPYGALADAGRFTSEGAGVLREALAASGIVQVTGVPGYVKGRQAVLTGERYIMNLVYEVTISLVPS